MKTTFNCNFILIDENPYEENLLINQSFLSYVYNYHLKIRIQPEPNTVDELEDEIAKHINENPVSSLMFC